MMPMLSAQAKPCLTARVRSASASCAEAHPIFPLAVLLLGSGASNAPALSSTGSGALGGTGAVVLGGAEVGFAAAGLPAGARWAPSLSLSAYVSGAAGVGLVPFSCREAGSVHTRLIDEQAVGPPNKFATTQLSNSTQTHSGRLGEL